MAELTSSQVRENLAELIDNTQRSGEPVGLTRYGRPVAVVLDHALFERLVAADDETSDRQALARALTISIYNSFSFGSSKYRTYLADQPISWTQARNHALILGGDYDLVSINSTEENIAIFNQIEPTLNAALWGTDILCCGGGEYLTGPWIGLFQPPDSTEPAGNWQWVDGTSLTSNGYFNWLPGMPNNSLGGDNFGNILAFSSIYQWGWNDAIDNSVIEFNGTGPVLAFVVEDETNGAPGPLPALGAAAAFGFSRQLRKRIKSNPNAVSCTYSL